MTLFQWLIGWLWRWYVDLLVCLHFCGFRRAGSALKYTHVHILPANPQGATGLGHDDETNNDNAAHASVSKGGQCATQAENEASMALRRLHYLSTAYFHPAGADRCPEGFRSIRCKCGEEDVRVCYTLEHDVFQQWYEEQSWSNKTGAYAYPHVNARSIPDGVTRTLACPDFLVLHQFEVQNAPNCTGFGPGDADNALVQQARTSLQAASGRVTCGNPCQKRTTEIFRGWRCTATSDPSRWVVEAVVQWRVECHR